MTSGDRRDESVSVSLKELMKLEDERVSDEKRARDAEALAARRAREEAERREREAAEARLRAEAEDRERAKLRETEEEARREAMTRAAVEQARISVEARARAEEAERERRHEIELARIRAESAKKGGLGAWIGGGVAGASIAAVASLVLHFGVASPRAERVALGLEDRAARAEQRANEAELSAEHERARAAKAEADLAAAKKELDERKSAPPPTTKGGASGAGVHGGRWQGDRPATKSSSADGPCINDWDPLCGRIRTK